MLPARAALALVVIAAFTGCTGSAQTAASPAPGTSSPPAPGAASPSAAPAASPAAGEPDAAAIFASFRTDPNFVKVNTAPIKSGPHIGDVDIYVDKANADKFKTVGASAPDGMTVVKASLQDGQRAYIMKKIKGYDPANNDWYYANTKADGKVEMTGKPQMCISCHAGFKATDYLAAPASENAKALLK